MRVEKQETINGLDTAALGGLVELLKNNPQGGRVTFASRSQWQDGARVFTRIGGFRVDGQAAHEDRRNPAGDRGARGQLVADSR